MDEDIQFVLILFSAFIAILLFIGFIVVESNNQDKEYIKNGFDKCFINGQYSWSKKCP